MRKGSPTAEVLELIAGRFKALAEPARLRILNELRDGEQNVSDMVELTGLTHANLSKHLQLLHAHGFVARRREGLFVYYTLADKAVFQLCDIMCGRMAAESSARQKLLAS